MGTHVKGPFSCGDAGFTHQFALAGHGVVRGPAFSFDADFAAERLVPLLTGWRSPRELSIHALYPHRSLLSAKVRSFVDFLAERFGPGSEWEASSYIAHGVVIGARPCSVADSDVGTAPPTMTGEAGGRR
jgi:hypothetical protein